MAARHRKHKASGGKITNAGGNPYVEHEAEEKKKGGKVVGKMHGGHSKHRLDRPGRKRGGRVGADTSPLTAAHKSSAPDAAPHSNSST
jgi:hypothetical protein